MSLIFDLKDVMVEFDKNALTNRSLRNAIGSLLVKDFKKEKFTALNCINLSVFEGENIGIIGKNGAGKSTLLKVLNEIIIPQKGKVYRNDKVHIAPLLELGIGFQPDLSGRENCYMAGLLMGYTKKDIDSKIDGIIKFAELGDFIDEPVKNYSSGMYARLAFAIATDIEPEVLLVDEVFGVGDEFFMKKCIARMNCLMSKGTTTIFISHNIDFLITQCTRLIWIDKGQIIMDGEPNEVAEAFRRPLEVEQYKELQLNEENI